MRLAYSWCFRVVSGHVAPDLHLLAWVVAGLNRTPLSRRAFAF